MPPPRRRRNRQPERAAQAAILQLLRSIGAEIWSLGTTRASRCTHCGEYSTDMSTRQSAGLADIYAILPPPRYRASGSAEHWAVWFEVKAGKNKPSPDQEAFGKANERACVDYVVGDLDAVFAYLIAGGWLLEANVPHYRRPTLEPLAIGKGCGTGDPALEPVRNELRRRMRDEPEKNLALERAVDRRFVPTIDDGSRPSFDRPPCDHKFVDSNHCLKCGWQPTAEDLDVQHS